MVLISGHILASSACIQLACYMYLVVSCHCHPCYRNILTTYLYLSTVFAITTSVCTTLATQQSVHMDGVILGVLNALAAPCNPVT